MAKRITIKSIARDLGISHMTVSRALSNNPNVSKATRDAILARARELGYVKSAAASAMRGDTTRIVGLLLPNIVNEFYARFANTLATTCGQNGLHLIIHLTNDDPQAENIAIARLCEVQAMAVVMVPSPGGDELGSAHLRAMKVVQLIRQRPLVRQAAAVLVNDRDAIVQAVARLAQLGHRSIGYIGADTGLSSGRDRLAAFQQGLATAGLPVNPGLLRTDAPSFAMGRDYAGQLFTAEGATAILCGGFEISNGALNAFMDLPRARRSQCAFVGYGDPSFYGWIDGGLSTIRVPVDRLAHQTLAVVTDPDPVDDACFSFGAEFVDRGLSRI